MDNPVPTSAELAAMMERKRAFLRRRDLALSSDERWTKYHELQRRSMAQLRASPEAWDRFWRRNLAKRAIVWHEAG